MNTEAKRRADAMREDTIEKVAAVIAADEDYIGGVEDADRLARRAVAAFAGPS